MNTLSLEIKFINSPLDFTSAMDEVLVKQENETTNIIYLMSRVGCWVVSAHNSAVPL